MAVLALHGAVPGLHTGRGQFRWDGEPGPPGGARPPHRGHRGDFRQRTRAAAARYQAFYISNVNNMNIYLQFGHPGRDIA